MPEQAALPNRRNNLMVFRDAPKYGAYDEFPILRPEVDPQVHASRSDHPQPFFLTLEKDCVLVSAAGDGVLLLQHDDMRRYHLVAGDFVYLPGGTPHRLIPNGSMVTLRYKARDTGLEELSWHCDPCGTLLDTFAWDGEEMLAQDGYAAGVRRFNDDQDRRMCRQCGHVAPVIDQTPYRWDEIARAIRADIATDAGTTG